jgi:UDP-N-acetylglucosamine 1-carboxyvinyltransferase
MVSVLTNGNTTIRNCACEPEIVDLADMLNKMGAKITGAGTPVIEVRGVEGLHGVKYTPIPDRIVAGTLMLAVGMCGGEVVFENAVYNHIETLAEKLAKTACHITHSYDIIKVILYGKPKSFDITTLPYPNFPTDLQSQVMAYASVQAEKV